MYKMTSSLILSSSSHAIYHSSSSPLLVLFIIRMYDRMIACTPQWKILPIRQYSSHDLRYVPDILSPWSDQNAFPVLAFFFSYKLDHLSTSRNTDRSHRPPSSRCVGSKSFSTYTYVTLVRAILLTSDAIVPITRIICSRNSFDDKWSLQYPMSDLRYVPYLWSFSEPQKSCEDPLPRAAAEGEVSNQRRSCFSIWSISHPRQWSLLPVQCFVLQCLVLLLQSQSPHNAHMGKLLVQ